MKSLAYVLVIAAASLSLGAGCAPSSGAQPVAPANAPTMTTASTAAGARTERRVLAEGVELVVSEEAGLEARRIAEEFQAEMRSRYIGAR